MESAYGKVSTRRVTALLLGVLSVVVFSACDSYPAAYDRTDDPPSTRGYR